MRLNFRTIGKYVGSHIEWLREVKLRRTGVAVLPSMPPIQITDLMIYYRSQIMIQLFIS